MLQRSWPHALIGLSVLLSSACGGGDAPKATRQPTPLDLSTTGVITGVVRFEGTAPEQSIAQLSGWSECAGQHPEGNPKAGDVLVNDGKLQNTMVYIKDGLENRVFALPSIPVVLDQKGCVFLPRVLGVQTDQPLQMLNSDPLSHNVHGLPKNSASWNFSLGVKGMSRTTSVAKAEAMIEVKCDVHPWMRSYLGVFEHPYFMLSGADGAFALKDVPPGEYTVEAWHERFGVQTQKVTLGAKESKTLEFTFQAGR